ncbi:helix loop helix domain [Mactra antiquata]
MSVYHRSTAKSRILQEFREREEEIYPPFSRQMTHRAGLETEKRMRREIANSNERRRMQSINAGFQHLRSMLPHTEGEKLSKAAILQHTTEYIRNLQQEKAKIHAQNAYYKRILNEVSRRCNIDLEMDISLCGGSPPLKRKKRDTESSDEGISADFEELKNEECRREILELRQKLQQERHLRVVLELRAQTLESHHYAEKLHGVDGPLESMVKTVPSPSYVKWTGKEEIKGEEKSMMIQGTNVESDTDHRVPASPPHRPESQDTPISRPEPQDTPSSMSRRNLETIVEAIRHLEGEDIKTESEPRYSCPNSQPHHHQDKLLSRKFYSERSEESENSCDPDDLRSEGSGRDSPSVHHHHHNYVRQLSSQNSQIVTSVNQTKVLITNSNYSDKYPAVTNVLQGNSPQLQMYCRPGVIVQKS